MSGRQSRKEGSRLRILFLFNHDQTHQLAHSLPIGVALNGLDEVDVVLAATSSKLVAEIRRLAGPSLRDSLPVVELGLRTRLSWILVRAFGKLLPARKILIYRDNLDFFRKFDALVVSEKTSLLLKTRYGLEDVQIIHTRHGAGDRAIGFNKASNQFDKILVSGRKIYERLVTEAGVAPEKLSIVGYPKFDLVGRNNPGRIFDNGRPTVLYNPHCSPHLSSWHGMGRQVLEYFADSDKFNLIFAPHVMLFERRIAISIDKLRIARTARVPDHYRGLGHLLVDTGSIASCDMTYVNAADVYIGDVSSQVYEYLLKPRPCVFLNAHGVDFRGDRNYAHWAAGPVISEINELHSALHQSIVYHDSVYRHTQEKLFSRSYDLDGRSSSNRAAEAILEFMEVVPDVHPTRLANS